MFKVIPTFHALLSPHDVLTPELFLFGGYFLLCGQRMRSTVASIINDLR